MNSRLSVLAAKVLSLVLLVGCFFSASLPLTAHAISIDSLQGAQSATAGTVTSQTILQTSQALGGVREIAASAAVVAAVSGGVGSGSLKHTQSSSTGQTTYITCIYFC